MNKDGIVYIGTQSYSLAELETFLQKRTAENPNAAAFISGDKDLAFQKFVAVMDVLNKSGIRNAAVKHDYPQN